MFDWLWTVNDWLGEPISIVWAGFYFLNLMGYIYSLTKQVARLERRLEKLEQH